HLPFSKVCGMMVVNRHNAPKAESRTTPIEGGNPWALRSTGVKSVSAYWAGLRGPAPFSPRAKKPSRPAFPTLDYQFGGFSKKLLEHGPRCVTICAEGP